jgi:putative transposase
VAAWQSATLEGLDLVALFIDGVVFGEHCLVVGLGIDATGEKHPLGIWDGSTENATVCQGLLRNLQRRGLRTDRSLLVILDGSKALRKAVTHTFGQAALVQRGQVHKTRNILEYLPERQRPWVHAILRRAYGHADRAKARRLLDDLAKRLEDDYPSAAASVREGLEETLTVVSLPISDRLRRSLATTNPIESLMSRSRHVHPQRQTLAERQDDDPVDDRRRGGSRQRISAGEGLQGPAGAGHGAAVARRTDRALEGGWR